MAANLTWIMSSLLETLKAVIRESAATMNSLVAAELESVEAELKTLECYLKDASEKQDTHQSVRDCINDINKNLDDVEDYLDEYRKSSLGRRIFCRFDECLGSHRGVVVVGKKEIIAASKDKIRACIKNLELLGVKKTTAAMDVVNFIPANQQFQRWQEPSGCQNFSIGSGDDKETLLSALLGDKPDQICRFISIYGMGGIGKTSLARMVFSEQRVRRNFEGFAWAKVGQKFRTRKIFEDILLQLFPESEEEEIVSFSNLELVMQLYEIQLSKKYLIVLDDVWDKDAWICLKLVFPSHNSASKLIVTTRSKNVAEEVADKGMAHKMRILTKDESWELFVENASSGGLPGMFASNNQPEQSVDNLLNGEMHYIAMNLMEKCGGLPLALVSLGKLLGRKHALDHCKLVHQRITRFASTELGPEETKIPRVLALTHYFDLPYYLKPCFLYLGLFPQDSLIRSETLFLLWIAEGLIPSTAEKSLTRVDIAECYLDELINRRMVQMQEEKALTSTRSKAIHLHDLIRDLCVVKGKEENFFDFMDLETSNQLKYFDLKTRRLALYFYKNDDGRLVSFMNEKIHPLRSLLLFNCIPHKKDMTSLPDISNLKYLRFLKVLHFDGFKFVTGKSLKRIGELTFLKYLSFSRCTLDELPSSMGNLIHLETLDLRVETSTKIYIPNVLWRIVSLRDLYLPLQFWVHPDEKLRLDSLKNLETLQNFDTSLCHTKDLIKLPKLCYLEVTIDENLDDLETIANNLRTTSKGLRQSSFNIKSSNCYSERRHSILAKLFEFRTLYNLRVEGHMGNLPQMISSSLTELVLSRSELFEDPMARLEKFPRLCILELKNDSFLGKQMVCSALGFPQLRLLKLSNLHYLENLSIEKGAMPNLSTLAIESCKKLDIYPEVFNHLSSLQWLKIAKCRSRGQGERRNPSELWDVHAI